LLAFDMQYYIHMKNYRLNMMELLDHKCEQDDCQECCEHDEHEHGVCINCGKDIHDSLVSVVDFED